MLAMWSDSLWTLPATLTVPLGPLCRSRPTWLMILAGFVGLGCLGLRRSRRPEVARAAS